MYKQVIIVRKDLQMSTGKVAAQVCHASMAFLTWMIRNNTTSFADNFYRANVSHRYMDSQLNEWAKQAKDNGELGFYAKRNSQGKFELCDREYHYETRLRIDNDLYEQWICGEFTKVVLQAKNKNHLLKAKTMAEEMGMVEGKEFFLIRDNCRTELEPEEFDKNGVGRTLTCIGFAPMENEVIDRIGRKYHLYM